MTTPANVARLAAALFEYANRNRRHDYTHPLCVIAGPDRSHSETAAAAILAADPTLAAAIELGLAFDAVPAPMDMTFALTRNPSGGAWTARIWTSSALRAAAYRQRKEREARATGPTPAAALNALAESLKGRKP